jgi:hypothetical protein
MPGAWEVMEEVCSLTSLKTYLYPSGPSAGCTVRVVREGAAAHAIMLRVSGGAGPCPPVTPLHLLHRPRTCRWGLYLLINRLLSCGQCREEHGPHASAVLPQALATCRWCSCWATETRWASSCWQGAGIGPRQLQLGAALREGEVPWAEPMQVAKLRLHRARGRLRRVLWGGSQRQICWSLHPLPTSPVDQGGAPLHSTVGQAGSVRGVDIGLG